MYSADKCHVKGNMLTRDIQPQDMARFGNGFRECHRWWFQCSALITKEQMVNLQVFHLRTYGTCCRYSGGCTGHPYSPNTICMYHDWLSMHVQASQPGDYSLNFDAADDKVDLENKGAQDSQADSYGMHIPWKLWQFPLENQITKGNNQNKRSRKEKQKQSQTSALDDLMQQLNSREVPNWANFMQITNKQGWAVIGDIWWVMVSSNKGYSIYHSSIAPTHCGALGGIYLAINQLLRGWNLIPLHDFIWSGSHDSGNDPMIQNLHAWEYASYISSPLDVVSGPLKRDQVLHAGIW